MESPLSRPLRSELLQAQTAEADFERLLVLPHAVDLESDEPRADASVLQIRGRHVVEPGLDRIAAAFDAKPVPLAAPERLARGFVVLQVVQPAPRSFLVHARGPGAI